MLTIINVETSAQIDTAESPFKQHTHTLLNTIHPFLTSNGNILFIVLEFVFLRINLQQFVSYVSTVH